MIEHPRRTNIAAPAAANTLAAVDLFGDAQRHRASRFTFAAADAFFLHRFHLIKREPVEQPIKRPQRAKIPAEYPRNLHRAKQYGKQNRAFP